MKEVTGCSRAAKRLGETVRGLVGVLALFKMSGSSGSRSQSGGKAGSRVHWLALFAALLLISSAVPVLAAEPPPNPSQEIAAPATPEDFDPSQLPSAEDVNEAIEKAELEEEERNAWLASPEAVLERQESRLAFADLDDTAIRDLVNSAFAEQLAQLNADPARFLSDAQLLTTSEETSATVKDEGNGLIMESSLPVRAEDEGGDLRKVDLSLEETGSGFETENALVEVQIPEAADQPIEVGEEGIAIKLAGADDEGIAQPFGDENTLAVEVLPDTDMLVSPIATGVEIFNILRSENSPEILRFQVDIPAGAELRAGGERGAEVVKDGDLLTTIPEPFAEDAQGTDVPVDLQVEGSSLLLTVDHREGDYAMPILLDPQVLENNENWIYGQNHDALDMGVWAFNKNVAGMYGSTYCIYHCFGQPSNVRGLFVSGQSGTYWPNQFAQWSYSAPNPDSYITSVTLSPWVRYDHGCNAATTQYKQPHDYFGIWSGSAWVQPASVNSTNQPGNQWTLPYDGQAVIFGLGSGGSQFSIPCWRDIYAGGAHVWLDDNSQPVLTTTSTGQWMDTSPVRLNVRATDPGLGVRKFEAEATNKSGATQIWETWHSCAGTRRSPCPGTWNLAEASQPQLAFDPSALPEGIVTLNVTAFDATLRKSTTTNGMTVRIDHAPPTIKLSGTITEQATLGTEKPKYTVRVDASDGIPNDPNPANARSGVASISEWVDGVKVNEYAPGCSTQSCSWFDEGAIEAAAYSPGLHTLVAKAKDALGHPVESNPLQFTLGDTQAPTINVTGLPAESSAMSTRATYWRAFGVNGAGDGQLKSPADVAVGAEGNLFVLDRENNRVQKFDPSGKYLGKFGSFGAGNGQFSLPTSIATDPAGNLLVTDANEHRVQKFSSQGTFLSKFGAYGTGNGQLYGPGGIAVDAQGNIWVADSLNHRVQKFNDKGEFLKVIGAGQLSKPTGIDIDPSGNAWVADWANNRVLVFNNAGTFLSQFGSAGSGNGQFNHPQAVEVDNHGSVWIGDQGNNRVQQFNLAAQYKGQFGSTGSGAGQFSFNYPMGIVSDSKGRLWVADTNNSRIQEWLVPNTTVSGYLEPLNASASDNGFGVASIAVKLINQSGTEILGQTSQSCSAGGCPLNYKLEELDLSEKPAGAYVLAVTATDAAGNVREVSRVLNLDSTPPELDLSGPLAESAGQPLNAASAVLEIGASDSDPASGGVSQVNVERDGQLVASYPSDCSSDCHEVDASYTFRTAVDGADRAIKPASAVGNGSIGELRRLSCVASNNCWAVGRTKYTAAELTQGKVPEELLERWNGSEWQMTTIPKPAGATSITLEDISCVTASACLAVGSYSNGTTQPLVERWDGSKWTASQGPLPAGATKGSLTGISCAAVSDCWAYGKTQVTLAEQNEGKVATPFFSRWNGSEWQTTTIPKPAGATSITLEDISCVTASACLAVGSYSNGTTQPLVERWDGSKWTASSGPLPAGATKGFLSGISCGTAANCWAHGKTQVTVAEQNEGKTAAPFFARWNGSNWQVEVMAKAPDGSPTTVTSLSCHSTTACTAVGRYTNLQGETLPLAYTWDAAGWRFQPMPIKTEANNSSLEGISCTAANECAAVGYSRIGSGQWQVLAEAETPDGGPHEVTVEAIDAQGNSASETIEIDIDPTSAAPPECDTDPKLKAAQGTVTSTQAIDTIKKALPAAVAPTDGAITPSTEEMISPSYGPPSPNLETVDSLATGETSITPEGGFTLGDSVCITPATLTPAATDATVVSGDTALFANTAPETDTVIRPTAMGATVIHSLRGPNAPDTFAWNVSVSPGQDLVELPSGGVAVVEIGSEAEEVAQVPSVPKKSSADLADVEVQVENGEYQLINAADETELEVVAVIAQPWVVLAQGGIVPALIEVVPDTEIPNEFEVWISLSATPEEEAVWPVQLIADMAGASSLNGSCPANESPCGGLDLDRMAQYAVYWGNEAHHFARNPFYANYGSNNCTNFISQILRAGGGKFMRAFDRGDGSWWYRNLSSGGIFGTGPSAGWEDTASWRLSDTLPRHLWRFGLAYIDSVQQPWGWIKGNILAYDWIDSDGKGNVNHLNFVVGTQDLPGGREPLIANSSSQGSNYPHKTWLEVRKRVEAAHGSQWTRFALAARHRVANLNAKKHDPDNLYGSNGLFGG